VGQHSDRFNALIASKQGIVRSNKHL